MIREVNERVLTVLKQYNEKEKYKEYLTKKTAFSREEAQKMTFEDMTMFMLSNTGKSLSLEILKYFNDTCNIENTITKQAVSKQRKYIDSKIFDDMNISYANEIYKTRNETFCGYTLMAIDGSTAEIPNTKNLKEIYGATKASETSESNARVGLNGFYDSTNHIMIKLIIDKYQRGEKTVFLENVEEVIKIQKDKKLLFIFDRGYICLELLIKLEELGIKYLFRVASNCYKKELSSATSNDENINIKITKARLKNIEEEKQKEYLKKEYKKERLVQVELDTGEIEYLITNLTPEEVPHEKMKELYYERWNIEKAFNILKNRLQIENISARTKNGVEQDIKATVFLGNIVEDMAIELNKSLSQKKTEEYEYRTNINILAGILKTYFIYFFCTQAISEKLREHYYTEMLKYIKKNLVLVKKGKRNPRNKRVSRNKYKTNIRKNY